MICLEHVGGSFSFPLVFGKLFLFSSMLSKPTEDSSKLRKELRIPAGFYNFTLCLNVPGAFVRDLAVCVFAWDIQEDTVWDRETDIKPPDSQSRPQWKVGKPTMMHNFQIFQSGVCCSCLSSWSFSDPNHTLNRVMWSYLSRREDNLKKWPRTAVTNQVFWSWGTGCFVCGHVNYQASFLFTCAFKKTRLCLTSFNKQCLTVGLWKHWQASELFIVSSSIAAVFKLRKTHQRESQHLKAYLDSYASKITSITQVSITLITL